MSTNYAPEGAPLLHNEGVYSFFNFRWDLPAETRARLLRELPSDTFAADCCAILKWGIEEYDSIKASDDADQKSWAVIHAYFFAGALGRTELVPCLLQLLAAPKEVLDYYFDYHLTEEGWWPLRQYLPDAMDDYLAFLRRKDVYEYAKTPVLGALLYTAYEGQEAADLILPALRTYMRECIADPEAKVDIHITELATRFIDDGTEEGLSVGKAAFEAGLVDLSYAGGLQNVLQSRGKYPNVYAKGPYKTIDALYDSLATSYALRPSITQAISEFSPQQPIVKEAKIGRNDPCPCGSGKKYKKCCLKAA